MTRKTHQTANNRRPWLLPLLALWLLLCAPLALAATPVALAKEGERLSLRGHIDYLPDNGAIDEAGLLAGEYDERFQPYDAPDVNFQSGAVWLRMRIANSTPLASQVLSTGYVLFTDALLLYNRAAEGQPADIVRREAGLLHVPIKQDWPYYDIAWQLEIPPDQMRTIYLRLHTPYRTLLNPYVTDSMSYGLYQMRQGSLSHIAVGIMLGVLFYLSMIALFVHGLREVRHCIAFITTSFFIVIYMRGYLFHLLPHWPWLKMYLHPLLFSLQALTYISFSRQHFNTADSFPYTDLLLRGGQYLAGGMLLLGPLLPILWAVNGVIVMAFGLLVLLCVTSVYVWANSERRLTIYIAGTLVFLFACMLLIAEASGFIDLGGWSRDAYEGSICLQTILFALALAETISNYQSDQARLAISAAEAEAENRAKSSFLAKMSHELRTPMNGLLGMLQLLERTPLNDQQQHYVQVMRNAGRLLLGVIDDVLDYSRIVAGKLRIDERDFDLTEVLADIEAMFTQAARQKMLHMHFSINTSNPVVVNGDVTRLRQILINLVSNAIKFTEQGTVTVRIQVEQSSAEQWLLHGEVEDTGIGIEQQQMQHLFREYAQADGVRGFGGSGLGLVICKQLVEMMSGHIHVESAPGYGSLFRFQIVVRPPQHPTAAPDRHALQGRYVPSGARILVAEDNDTNSEVIVGLLQQLGYRAECVSNGAEAVRRICQSAEQWDLVLMDVEMPVMDGLEAARKIRQWEAAEYRNAIPIIALTAHAMRDHEEKSRRAGMDDHLSKPVDISLLQNMLAKWLPFIATKPAPLE